MPDVIRLYASKGAAIVESYHRHASQTFTLDSQNACKAFDNLCIYTYTYITSRLQSSGFSSTRIHARMLASVATSTLLTLSSAHLRAHQRTDTGGGWGRARPLLHALPSTSTARCSTLSLSLSLPAAQLHRPWRQGFYDSLRRLVAMEFQTLRQPTSRSGDRGCDAGVGVTDPVSHDSPAACAHLATQTEVPGAAPPRPPLRRPPPPLPTPAHRRDGNPLPPAGGVGRGGGRGGGGRGDRAGRGPGQRPGFGAAHGLELLELLRRGRDREGHQGGRHLHHQHVAEGRRVPGHRSRRCGLARSGCAAGLLRTLLGPLLRHKGFHLKGRVWLLGQ